MPFDPRIVAPDDDYPDDEKLEELGTQLLADARHLADVYPAKSPGRFDPMTEPVTHGAAEVAANTSRYRRRLAVAAGLVVLAAVVAAQWGMRQSSQPLARQPIAAPLASGNSLPTPSKANEFKTNQVITESNELAVPVSLPSLESGLTGPEWEGVLDLMEPEAGKAQSISL